jgi:hypothetical protein
MWGCGLDSSGLEQRPAVGSSEYIKNFWVPFIAGDEKSTCFLKTQLHDISYCDHCIE